MYAKSALVSNSHLAQGMQECRNEVSYGDFELLPCNLVSFGFHYSIDFKGIEVET